MDDGNTDEVLTYARLINDVSMNAADLALNTPEGYLFAQDFIFTASGLLWLLACFFASLK